MYTNPRWDRSEIEAAYRKDFTDDPSRGECLPSGGPGYREHRFRRGLDWFGNRLMVELKPFVDPKGKRWLELRFKDGALIQILRESGAEVSGIDLFKPNVDWARERTGCDDLHAAGIWDLLAPASGEYDVISMLTSHIVAHSPSPMRMLAEVKRFLRPGGHMIIREKDVSQMSPGAIKFPIRHPWAAVHYHHLTLESVKRLTERAGFQLVHAEYLNHSTNVRHFLIVARKCAEGESPVIPERVMADDPDRIYRHMMSMFFNLLVKPHTIKAYLGAYYKASLKRAKRITSS